MQNIRPMHIVRFVLLLLLLVAALHLLEKRNSVPATYSDAEAYKVYSAILPDEWTWRDAQSETLVIQAETKPYAMCLVPDPNPDKSLESAIANYKLVNEGLWRLGRLFDISKAYQLASQDLLSAPFKAAGPQGWQKFNADHPHSVGWIELSAVGFNEDKTIAVVYVGHHCGGLCGGGGFRVLQKVRGRWNTFHWIGSSCAWAS